MKTEFPWIHSEIKRLTIFIVKRCGQVTKGIPQLLICCTVLIFINYIHIEIWHYLFTDIMINAMYKVTHLNHFTKGVGWKINITNSDSGSRVRPKTSSCRISIKEYGPDNKLKRFFLKHLTCNRGVHFRIRSFSHFLLCHLLWKNKRLILCKNSLIVCIQLAASMIRASPHEHRSRYGSVTIRVTFGGLRDCLQSSTALEKGNQWSFFTDPRPPPLKGNRTFVDNTM